MNDTCTDSLAEIKKGLTLLHRESDVIELRVPRNHDEKYSPVTSGFFRDFDKLAEAIKYLNEKYETAVFVTLNPIKVTWQSVNDKCYVGGNTLRQELEEAGLPLEPRMKKTVDWETGEERYSMRTTDGSDILRRIWALIDIDAGQPVGMNSSEEEHEDTLLLSEGIREYLMSCGFPAPAWTDSGNGTHLYPRINLENTPENEVLIKRFLLALAQRFDGTQGKASIDTGMFDSNRITKAAGTVVFKGPDTTDRPRRRSHVIQETTPRFAMREQIEEIANEYILKAGETLWTPKDSQAIGDAKLNDKLAFLKELFDFYEIKYGKAQMSGEYLVLPCTCPNEDEHSMDGGPLETVASVRVSGELGFCCQHHHCQSFRGWKNFKAYMERTTGKAYAVGAFVFGKGMMNIPKSVKTVLSYYFSLNRERFCMSLETIAKETGLHKQTVLRANNRLREYGILTWASGYGNRAAKASCLPNQYKLDHLAVKRHEMNLKRDIRTSGHRDIETSGHQHIIHIGTIITLDINNIITSDSR